MFFTLKVKVVLNVCNSLNWDFVTLLVLSIKQQYVQTRNFYIVVFSKVNSLQKSNSCAISSFLVAPPSPLLYIVWPKSPIRSRRFSWPRPSLSFKVSYGQQYLQKTVTAKMFELDDALGEPKMGRLSRNHLLLETPCTKTCAESRTSITERNTELARAGDVMMALATRISVFTVQINGWYFFSFFGSIF